MYWNLLGVGNNYLEILSNTAKVVKTIGSLKLHFGAKRPLNILKAVPELGVGNINGTSCLKNRNDN